MSTAPPPRYGPAFWLALVAGWALIGVGVAGALADPDLPRPAELARWLVGAALVHDLLVAPVVVLVGLAVARLVPPTVRGTVEGGLVVSAVVVLFAVPLVRGYGVRPDNPTVHYRDDYGVALLAVVAFVWAVTAAVAAGQRWRRRGRLAGDRAG